MASVAMAATGGAVGFTATWVRGDVGSRRREFTATGVRAWRPLVVEPIAGGRPSLVCLSLDTESTVKGNEAVVTSPQQSALPFTESAIGSQQRTSLELIRQNMVKEIILSSAEEIRRGKEALARGEELIEQLKLEARNGRSLEDIQAKMAEQEKSFFGACYNFYTVDEKGLAQVLLFQKKQAEQEQNAVNIIKKSASKTVETILGKLLSLFPFFRAN